MADITRETTYEDLPDWLTIQQAAEYLGRSYWLVYQAVHRGEVPYRRIGPKLIFIPKKFFAESLAAKQITSVLEAAVR